MPLLRSRSSGGAGTSRYPPGFAITFTFPSAEAGCPGRAGASTSWWSSSSVGCGTARIGLTWFGADCTGSLSSLRAPLKVAASGRANHRLVVYRAFPTSRGLVTFNLVADRLDLLPGNVNSRSRLDPFTSGQQAMARLSELHRFSTRHCALSSKPDSPGVVAHPRDVAY